MRICSRSQTLTRFDFARRRYRGEKKNQCEYLPGEKCSGALVGMCLMSPAAAKAGSFEAEHNEKK